MILRPTITKSLPNPMAGKSNSGSHGKSGASSKKPIVIKRPGALTAKAKKAGEGVQEFAKNNASKPGLLGKQARFAENAAKWNKGK